MVNNINDQSDLAFNAELKEVIHKAIDEAMTNAVIPYPAKKYFAPIWIEQIKHIGKNKDELKALCIEHFLCFVGFIHTNVNQRGIYNNSLLHNQLLINPVVDSIKCHFNFEYKDNGLVVEPINYPFISFFPVTFFRGDDLNEIGNKIDNLKIECFIGNGGK